MKKVILMLISILASANVNCQQSADDNKEKEAIIALIQEETQSYYDKDFERWSNCYVKSDDNLWMAASRTWNDYRVGWEVQADFHKTSFETEKMVNIEAKKPIIIKIYDKSAWIVFDNEVINEEGESTEKVRVTYFLEKPVDKWKIVYSNRIYKGSYYLAEWPMINLIAYAKSLGKNSEDIGSFNYENTKENLGSDLGYEDYQNAIINQYTNLTPPDGMNILEQDDNHVIFIATGFATNLKKEGSIDNVSYKEYLAVDETFWTKLGDHFGADYNQGITDDGVKVSVSKKK